MDVEGAVKAPLTRLRRRLSVEADDVKSPVTTPTKKRGGRLAAKPQLELIDENTTDNTPKKQSRKTKAKEIAEAEVSEDKAVTPSRRSARIRSNTSLILEPTQCVDSPRAKRAARRTSQVGSDNEAPLTPARLTRRTRKESSSSIDKSVETNVNKTPNKNEVAEIILEETECNDDPVEKNVTSARKSPRTSKRSSKSKELKEETDDNNEIKSMKPDQSNEDNIIKSTVDKGADMTNNVKKNTNVEQQNDKFNYSTDNLIINMDTKSRITRGLNKTASGILEKNNDFKSKRHRTKSWSTSFIPQTSDENFFSDNEIIKKKKKNPSLLSNQGDNVIFDLASEQKKKLSLNKSLLKKRNSSQMDKSITDAQINNSAKGSDNLFDKSPDEMHTQVFVVDSDTDSIGKIKQDKLVNEDQCVPVINHEIENIGSGNLKTNCSYEPMDIDETMPQNISFENFDDKNKSNTTKRKPSINVSSNSTPVTENHSKSESQIMDKISNEDKSTLILSQLRETSNNEIKNISKKDTSQLFSKSMNSSDATKDAGTEKKNVPSNYMTSTPVQQKSLKKLGMQIDTSIISPKCSNNKENLNEPENVLRKSNGEKSVNQSQRKISKNDSVSSDESEEEEELSKHNEIFDDEAEEANNSYESGESQDEDEKQYEQQNEIVEKGETLETEDEISDDSDYEKDSFIVSSDAEDDELLSGSGDDLSMSDNELKMTAKSKQKYNERKIKEQKKASKEMYEARHNINNSDEPSDKSKTKKSKRQRLDSSTLNSDNDDDSAILKQKGKSNNRHRINSSQDISIDNSDIISKKKKKSKRLSESACEGDANDKLNSTNESQVELDDEKEITIENDAKLEDDPLIAQIKQEAKSPQKFNMSVVKITDNIEEVHVAANTTLLNANETSDPLENNETDYESDSSSNEKIMDDYNLVLKNLSTKAKKIKDVDTSLNVGKKKKKVKEPIIDELNLTKPKFNNKQKISMDGLKKTQKINEDDQQDDDAASDSIDMKLLFPEDSNDSVQNEEKVNQDKSKPKSPVPDFIPLKRTEAKVDISVCNESMSKVNTKNNSFNSSKKSLKSSHSEIEESDTTSENVQPLQFFIDKIGNEPDHHRNVSSQNNNKKHMNKSICEESIISLDGIFSSGKKKNKKISFSNNDENEDVETSQSQSFNVTPSTKSEQKTKKGKKSLDSSMQQDSVNNLSQNNDTLNTSSSKKNKENNNSQDKSMDENNIFNKFGEEIPSEPVSDKKFKNKDKKKLQNTIEENADISLTASTDTIGKKKKEKKHSTSLISAETEVTKSVNLNSDDEAPLELSFTSTKKITNYESHKPEIEDNINQDNSNKKSKKRKRKSSQNAQENARENEVPEKQKLEEVQNVQKKRKICNISDNVDENKGESNKKKNKKRKEREDDSTNSTAKVFKGNSFDQVTVSRLPSHILSQLDDKPKKKHSNQLKKPDVISTTNFTVEERKVRKNKPSNYLEDSIYLNDSNVTKKSKGMLKKPKVLPFIPTASTSDAGFTTNFKINVLPQDMKFVAQVNNVTNFKDQLLEKNRLKKFHTFETYKRQRNRKVANYF